jgi:superfamily II DNA or RNA helicase
MKVSYIIHKLVKDDGFSLAITLKVAGIILSCDARATLEPLDKKIADHIIKDFNACKTLKQSPLEYGKFEKVPISDKQLSTLLIELAKTKEVLFETKKVVIDALGFSKLFLDLHVSPSEAVFEAFIIDGVSKYGLKEMEAFWGQDSVWILHHGVLKRLKTAGKWFKMALSQEPITGKKLQLFLDHYDNELPLDSSIPEAKFSYEEEKKFQIEPLVILKNTQGLFLELHFNYGPLGIFGFKDPKNQKQNHQDEMFWHNIICDLGVKKSGPDFYVSAHEREKIFTNLLAQGIALQAPGGKKIKLLTTSKAVLKTDEVLASLNLELNFEGTVASLEAIKEACQSQSPLIKLTGGDLGLISPSMLEDLQLSFKGHISGGALITRADYKGDFIMKSFKMQSHSHLSLENAKFHHFKLQLLEFQKLGVAWLLSCLKEGRSCLLADDMGLGKTIQTLAVIDLLRGHLSQGILLICPKSLKLQWQQAAQTHLGAEASHLIIKTFHEVRALPPLEPFSLCVIDEAQNIKNPKTQLFQKISQIQAPLKLALTGTPVENSLNDLLSIFAFLNPELIAEFSQGVSSVNQNKFKKRLAPFILRRTKQEVLLELPELFEQTCYVDMDELQASSYISMIENAKKEPVHSLALLTRLRLAALDPRLIDNSITQMSSKTWQILEDIQTIVQSGQKVILFSQFTSYLALVKAHLEEMKLSYSYLDGSVKDRDKPLSEFKSSVPILLMSLKAGGVGLNLQEADYVLLADPWWNEAAEKQAIDRAYRLGRDRAVVARRYVTAGTLETKLEELKAYKWALLDEITSKPHHELEGVFKIIFS